MTSNAFKPSEEQRRQVKAMVAYGIQHELVASLTINPRTDKGISHVTLRKHFKRELEVGGAEATAQVAQALFLQATGRPASYDSEGNVIREEMKPNVGAQCFWLKTRANWKEQQDVNVDATITLTVVKHGN
tara:strand:- start:15740 stop:16132 length:393 start_codon:yes stop_codon:yes gene_type:complete